MKDAEEERPARPLEGRTALITGGGHGIGVSVAFALARAGARVALVGRPEEGLSGAVGALPHQKDGAVVIDADLAAPETPQRVLDTAVDRLGRVDILVTGATAENHTASHELTPDEADELWALNLRTPLLLSGRTAAHMASHGGGSIVTISSAVADEPAVTHQSLDAATHGSVDAVTKALAEEWGGKKVRVNAVRPVLTAPVPTAGLFGDPCLERTLSARARSFRGGTADDVAEAVLYLASPASSSVTGQTLSVDREWTATPVR
ncbi:SDR family NAD(P)-dependent oxidoreductase [Streptomyces tendae]